jgi:hypothetical protein
VSTAPVIDSADHSLSCEYEGTRHVVWAGQLHQVWDLTAAPFERESRLAVQGTDERISDLHAQEIGGINFGEWKRRVCKISNNYVKYPTNHGSPI